MGDQDVDHGVEAGRGEAGGGEAGGGEAGGGEAGGGGAAFTYLDPIQVLKRAPSSLAWKFFQFRKYETKVDETRVFCKLCVVKRREDGLPEATLIIYMFKGAHCCWNTQFLLICCFKSSEIVEIGNNIL
jgi:hypothetical protein